MGSKAMWALVRAVALAALMLASAAALTAEEPVVTTFTDASPDADGAPPPAGQVYCVYKIVTAQGNCGRFTVNAKLCIDCPGGGTCPSPPNQVTNFVYVDAFGNTICSGTWTRAFDLVRPNACVVCNNGLTGYVFVN